MRTVSESMILPCTPERFWQVFLDDNEYVKALFVDVLKFKDFVVLERSGGSRKIRAVPRLKLPAVIDKMVGDSFAYEEHGTLDRARNQWSWRMVQPAKADGGKPKKELVSTRGTIRVTAEGDGRCRRSDEVLIDAHLFGVGGLIESTVEKEVRASWAKELAFLEQWLKTHG